MPDYTAANADSRISLTLLLDTCDPDGGQRATELADGLRRLRTRIADDPLTAAILELSVIVPDTEPRLLARHAPAAVDPGPLPVGGERLLAPAVDLAIDLILERTGHYRDAGLTYLRPWLFVVSAGRGADPAAAWAAVSARCHQLDHSALSAYAACLPGAGSYDQLDALSLREPRNVTPGGTGALFDWLAECMVSLAGSDHFTDRDTRRLTLIPPSGAWSVEEAEDDDDDAFIAEWSEGDPAPAERGSDRRAHR